MNKVTYEFEPDYQGGGYFPAPIARFTFNSLAVVRMYFGHNGLMMTIPKSLIESGQVKIVEDQQESMLQGFGTLTKGEEKKDGPNNKG